MRTDGHIFVLQLEYCIKIHKKTKVSILPRKFPEDENLAQVRERLVPSPGELTNVRYGSLQTDCELLSRNLIDQEKFWQIENQVNQLSSLKHLSYIFLFSSFREYAVIETRLE